MIRALALALCIATPAAAQERVESGSGAILRVLDKLTGIVEDLRVPSTGAGRFGRITITMNDCRYPEGNPSGDAYALLSIREVNQSAPVFEGWIIATSPALNPMDHPRYDVWVLRCTTS